MKKALIIASLGIATVISVVIILKNDNRELPAPQTTTTEDQEQRTPSSQAAISPASSQDKEKVVADNEDLGEAWYVIPELQVKFKNGNGEYDTLFYVYDAKEDAVKFYDRRYAALTPLCAPPESPTHGTLVRYSPGEYEEWQEKLKSADGLPWWFAKPIEELPRGYASSSAFLLGNAVFNYFSPQAFCVPDELRQKYIDTIVQDDLESGFTNQFVFVETVESIK